MRDQIINGIENALAENSFDLTDGEVEALIESLTSAILDALTRVPDGTPAPAITDATAGPALTVPAAQVVAMLAEAAADGGAAVADSTLVHRYWPITGPRRAAREFAFAIQHLFGVRTRSITEQGVPSLLYAGTDTQIGAMINVTNALTEAARPVTETMSVEELTNFWATLGNLVSTSPEAHSLRLRNADAYTNASQYLNETFGPTRTLTRTAPTTSGPVAEAAAAIATTATSAL